MEGAGLRPQLLVCPALCGKRKEGEREKSGWEEGEQGESTNPTLTLSHSLSPSQSSRLYLDAVRECYEAYVIYNFFMYLRAYLEDEVREERERERG